MGWININGNWIGRHSGKSWSSYWSSLISATVEDANPDEVVLTFPTARPTLTDTDFTIAGKTITGAVWVGAVLTLTVSVPFVYGDTPVVTFVPTGGTANVTNNIAPEAELTTYITGLITPLSIGQRRLVNELIKGLKTAWSVTDLDDCDDVAYLLAGETAESSLKNLIKDANHALAVNSPTFTAFEGFQGDGISSYINTKYKIATHASAYKQDDAHALVYLRTNTAEPANDFRATNASNVGVSITGSNEGVNSGIYFRANSILHSEADRLTESCVGISGFDRSVNTEFKFVLNGTFRKTVASVSQALVDLEVYLLAGNLNGSPSLYATKTMSFFDMGKSLSEAQHTATKNVIEAYMDANGKGVIA